MSTTQLLSRATNHIRIAEQVKEQAGRSPDSTLKFKAYCYSTAWGFYRIAKNYEGMRVCTQKLEKLGFLEDQLSGIQKIGYDHARFITKSKRKK
jgi:hypothetical protein